MYTIYIFIEEAEYYMDKRGKISAHGILTGYIFGIKRSKQMGKTAHLFRYYDVTVFKHYSVRERDSVIKFKHLYLENITAYGVDGQGNFTDDEGNYYIIPWTMVYMMIPSRTKVEEKE